MKHKLILSTLIFTALYTLSSCSFVVPTTSETTSSPSTSETTEVPTTSESTDSPSTSESTDSPSSSESTDTPSTSEDSNSHEDSSVPQQLVYDEISVNFLTFGNRYNGDSTFIKVGDVDILIDAGSRPDSADDLTSYIDTLCTDGKLEYVIATHADRDHIACFTTYNGNGIFDTYEIGTLIDFANTEKTTKTYYNYRDKRDAMVANNEMIHHTADYYFTDGEANEHNHIQLTDTVTMDILYNPYYFEMHSGHDENEYSVCMMLNQGDNHFLFTGDLEKDGEAGMANYYAKRGGLPHVRLFKGGHHGSKTSSNEVLLSQITPEIVCICCCAGADEYTSNTYNQFPTQDVINRVAKYTTNVFVTTAIKYDSKGYIADGFEDLNGIITVFATKDGKIKVKGSNNTTKLKDSEWFNRTIMHQRQEGYGKDKVVTDIGLKPCRTWPNVVSMYNDIDIME